MMTDPGDGRELHQEPEFEPSWHADEMEYPPLDEETISQIAAESFLEYDLREAESGHQSGVPEESGSAFEEFKHHE